MNFGFHKSADWTGPLLAVFTAIAFGVITTFARVAYDGGSDVFTVVLMRSLFLVVVVGGYLLLQRAFIIPAISDWPALGIIALCTVAMGVLYLGAVAYIPVGLAAIIFYTFPLMVALWNMAGAREKPEPLKLAGFILAFAGLCVALGPSFEETDWRGIALALLGALSVAVLLQVTGRLRPDLPVATTNFFVNLLALPVFATLLFALSGPKFPVTEDGQLGLAAACGFFVVAMALMFAAVRRSGAVSTALVLNLEPLVSIIAAALILGERMTGTQYAGSALVLAALTVSGWRTKDRQATQP